MNFLGNIAWLLLGGIIVSLMYFIMGLLLCITIIGIPFGLQLIKFGRYALWPFGHTVTTGPGGMGCVSVAMNVIWILLGWWEIALTHLFFGLIFCVTIIGIPFGLQHFKIAMLSFLPFGRTIS